MKHIFTVIALSLLGLLQLDAKDFKEQIAKEQLPEVSQSFISKHFATKSIVRAVKEIDGIKVEFEVYLEGGIELTFDSKGEWKEVDAKGSEVPAAIVPKEIESAVASKYPKADIVQIEKSNWGWEIELNDGTEIDFNNKFKITDIDR